MLKKLPVQPQLEMLKTVLASFINPQHELCLLVKEIDWDYLEKEFTPLYGEVGRPSFPKNKLAVHKQGGKSQTEKIVHVNL